MDDSAEPRIVVKRYRKPVPSQWAPPQTVPRPVQPNPPHNSAMAPFRVDGIPVPSPYRPPRYFAFSSDPAPRPQFATRYTRTDRGLDEPVPRPSLARAPRSAPYPSTSTYANAPATSDYSQQYSVESGAENTGFARSSPTYSGPAACSAELPGKKLPLKSCFQLQRQIHHQERQKVFFMWRQLLGLVSFHSDLCVTLERAKFPEALERKMLDGFAESTLLRYLAATLQFLQALQDAGHSLDALEAHHILDILSSSVSDESEDLPCAINLLKALRWAVKILGLRDFPNLYTPLFQPFLENPNTESKESLPLPLKFLVSLEYGIIAQLDDAYTTFVKGAFLLAFWASLRFSDLQHIQWDTLIFNGFSLRGVSYRTKTSKKGVPWAIAARGFLGRNASHNWVHRWLAVADSFWQKFCDALGDEFVPDFILFSTQDLQINGPMPYMQALQLLRRFVGNLQECSPAQRDQYTLHSLKTTLLSWGCQIQASTESRASQGHHVVPTLKSVRLYGRDDVWAGLTLQNNLIDVISDGSFRPQIPQHRGGQIPLSEPAVNLPSILDLSHPEHTFRKIHVSMQVDVDQPCSSDHDKPLAAHEISRCTSEQKDDIGDADEFFYINGPSVTHIAVLNPKPFGVFWQGRFFKPKCGAVIKNTNGNIEITMPKYNRMCMKKPCLEAFAFA